MACNNGEFGVRAFVMDLTVQKCGEGPETLTSMARVPLVLLHVKLCLVKSKIKIKA